MFGWKFVPTLIAVIYTQFTAVILSTLKRTEPFARLAKPLECIPVARYTLLEKSKPWWTTLSHGFQKKRNSGSWNLAMVLSCLGYILAILGISPISAALLGTKEVEHTSSKAFKRITTHDDSPLSPVADRNTYLRTTGAILQNYSTSPWVTDDFLILPFWPSSSPDVGSRWDSHILQGERWEANTTVIQNNLVCNELELKRKAMYLRHADEDEENHHEGGLYLASVLLESDKGCHVNITINATSNLSNSPYGFSKDWISWGDTHHIMDNNNYQRDSIIRLNEECRDEDELILMSTPWWLDLESAHPANKSLEMLDNITMRAYACHTDHTMAIIPVNTTGTSNGLSVYFNKDVFYRLRKTIPSTMIDLEGLHKIYTDVAWSDFLPQRTRSFFDPVAFGGPAAMLGIGYNFSVPDMMTDPNLLTVAAKFRRRFSAEIIDASLQRLRASEEQLTTGLRTKPARHVLISGQAASVLCALLFTSFCLFLGVMWLTRPNSRNLNLYHDPGTILGSSLWAHGGNMQLSRFKTLDIATRKELKQNIANETYVTRSGRLMNMEIGNQIHTTCK
jgi:hypothetical protein